jgi:hypothetical protein
MTRPKIAFNDNKPNSVNGAINIITGSTGIAALKIQDSGDASSVTAETIPYEPTSLTPTIHDKINAITSVANLYTDIFVVDGISQVFTLTHTYNGTGLFLVFFGGSNQNLTDDYTITNANTKITMTYVPELGMKLKVIYNY